MYCPRRLARSKVPKLVLCRAGIHSCGFGLLQSFLDLISGQPLYLALGDRPFFHDKSPDQPHGSEGQQAHDRNIGIKKQGWTGAQTVPDIERRLRNKQQRPGPNDENQQHGDRNGNTYESIKLHKTCTIARIHGAI